MLEPDPPWVTVIPPELLKLKSKLPATETTETCAIAVDQLAKLDETRYSPATQNEDATAGSVPAPK